MFFFRVFRLVSPIKIILLVFVRICERTLKNLAFETVGFPYRTAMLALRAGILTMTKLNLNNTSHSTKLLSSESWTERAAPP